MIGHASGGEQNAVFVSQDSAEILIKSRLQIGGNQRHSVFGAKDNVVAKRREGPRHGSPVRLLVARVNTLPPLPGLRTFCLALSRG
jgi:hypothetical protein